MFASAMRSMPRILLVSHSGRFCSAGSLLYRCARALRTLAIDLEITFPIESPLQRLSAGYSNIDVRITSDPSLSHYNLILANTQACAAYVVELARIAPTVPVVLWIHEAWTHKRPNVMTTAMQLVSGLIFETPYQRDVIYASALPSPAVPIYIVPNTISDLGSSQQACTSKRFPRIVSVGALLPRKRQVDLARAVSMLFMDVECYIVGEQRVDDPELTTIIERCPDRFRLTGHVDNATSRALIRSADVFVHPSEVESQPLAILEAMSEGRPIIAADLPTYRFQHLVNGLNCLLYPVRDTRALGSRIRSLLRDKELATRLGAAASVTFEKYFRSEQFERRITQAIMHFLARSRIKRG